MRIALLARLGFNKDATAQGVAKQRLIESIAAPHRRLISDPFAERFVKGAGLIKLMGHATNVWLSHKLAPGFHEHLIARTRFLDDLIEVKAASGVAQCVILGAGYDSRAHRLTLPPATKIFEVDQAEVQNRKRSRLSRAGAINKSVYYVPVDFSKSVLSDELINSGFNPDKPAIFSLEGVSQYISPSALSALIQQIASLSQSVDSTFFLSYVDKLLVNNPKACFGADYPNPERRAKLVAKGSSGVGEPWISFYTSREIEDLFSRMGFGIEANVTLSDLNSRYFGPLGRALPEKYIFNLEHLVVAVKHRGIGQS